MNDDINVQDVEDINNLLTEMFNNEPSAETLATVVSEVMKMEGGLEDFMKNEIQREEQIREWLDHRYDDDGILREPPVDWSRMYKSNFDGVKNTGLNDQLNTEPVAAFEDVEDSSLSGCMTTGVEDIHDFFAVPHQSVIGDEDYTIDDIDNQITEYMSLPSSERIKQDNEFANKLGMGPDRLREIAGATSAWNEIREIKSMLDDIRSDTVKVQHRFENFIDIYVKDKIPK